MSTRNSNMLNRLEQYFAHRQSLGYKMETERRCLRSFGQYAELNAPGKPLTVDLALRWATAPLGAQRTYCAKRLQILRTFARYLAVLEPRTEIPPQWLLGPVSKRVPPYIYTSHEIAVLILESLRYKRTSWRVMHAGLRNATVIGLLACTGLRVGEALALENIDVDLDQELITVRQSKNLPMRLVPITDSAVQYLRRYQDFRDQKFDHCGRTDAFIRSFHGRHLPYGTLQTAFKDLCRRTGLKDASGHTPTLHDLRHTFACNHLLRAYKENRDINAAVYDLSVYLGHVGLASTYWYLSSVPALLEQCTKRWKAHRSLQPRNGARS